MTQDDIALMYQKANGWSPALHKITMEELERFAALVAAHEREACAKIAEEESERGLPDEMPKGTKLKMALLQIAGGTAIAHAIRSRG